MEKASSSKLQHCNSVFFKCILLAANSFQSCFVMYFGNDFLNQPPRWLLLGKLEPNFSRKLLKEQNCFCKPGQPSLDRKMQVSLQTFILFCRPLSSNNLGHQIRSLLIKKWVWIKPLNSFPAVKSAIAKAMTSQRRGHVTPSPKCSYVQKTSM